MRTVEQALEQILASVRPTGVQRVALADAYGRILAEDLLSRTNAPAWDNSAMDGYAVRAADVASASADHPVRLRVVEVVGAGSWPAHAITAGCASAVMTGAPIPEGADAIVMIEDTDGAREGSVAVHAATAVGRHIRRAGEDVRTGDRVVERGVRLTAGRVGLAAALGFADLPVARRPIVAILSTGDEVVPPGTPLRPGQIWSSNTAAIAGLVLSAGAVPIDRGIARDRLDALVDALAGCVECGADAIITTGGVSVGAFDFVKDAFAAGGGQVDFWRVRMKPGKPLAFGHVGGDARVPLFGLPGNPVSCMVNFLQFVRPWLLTAMGAARPFLPVVEAVAAEDLPEKPGRNSLMRVVLDLRGGAITARSTGTQSSGALSSMAAGHGFALFGPESRGAKAGEIVRVQIFDEGFLDRADAGYGW